MEARTDYLVQQTTLNEQIAELQNVAPGIDRLGIPTYNWLNDDQHGVTRSGAFATTFPNGNGLGVE